VARCLIEFPQMLGVTFLTLFLAIVPIGEIFLSCSKRPCCVVYHGILKHQCCALSIDSVNLYVFIYLTFLSATDDCNLVNLFLFGTLDDDERATERGERLNIC